MSNGTRTPASFGSTLTEITEAVSSLNVNGADGLRTLARSLSVPTRGVRKAALVTDVAAAIWAQVEADLKASTVKAPRTRNDNHTIGGSADIVDSLWALFTKDGGATVNDIHAVFTEGGVSVKRGTIVSRLATQRNNGMVSSVTVPDSNNRAIAFFSATGEWDQAAMARKFAKVQ